MAGKKLKKRISVFLQHKSTKGDQIKDKKKKKGSNTIKKLRKFKKLFKR